MTADDARRPRLFWPVIFDRGRVDAPRGFPTREEAVVYATLHLGAERVQIVQADDPAAAMAIARALPPRPNRRVQST